MTEKFNDFVLPILLESTLKDVSSDDYTEIPALKPYGFWVFLGGQFTPVRNMGHENRAEDITNAIPEFKKDYEKFKKTFKEYSYQHFFYVKGFVKLTIDGPLLYWTNPRWIVPNFVLTTSQKRTIKNIAEHYKIEIDKSN